MINKFQAHPLCLGSGFVFEGPQEDIYSDVKQNYFKYILKQEETVEIVLDLDENCYDLLCDMADEQDVTIDEVVANILKLYIAANPIRYRLLNIGETILPTDEFFHPGKCEWVLFERECEEDYAVTDSHNPFRRIME
jgi:hypothetical protein